MFLLVDVERMGKKPNFCNDYFLSFKKVSGFVFSNHIPKDYTYLYIKIVAPLSFFGVSWGT